jgi:hypothetical protein
VARKKAMEAESATRVRLDFFGDGLRRGEAGLALALVGDAVEAERGEIKPTSRVNL